MITTLLTHVCLFVLMLGLFICTLNRAFSLPHVVSSSLFQNINNSGYHFEFQLSPVLLKLHFFLTFRDFQPWNHESKILAWSVCTFPSWGDFTSDAVVFLQILFEFIVWCQIQFFSQDCTRLGHYQIAQILPFSFSKPTVLEGSSRRLPSH